VPVLQVGRAVGRCCMTVYDNIERTLGDSSSDSAVNLLTFEAFAVALYIKISYV
jgi:hypothetical protein